jgi:hypothetical protein
VRITRSNHDLEAIMSARKQFLGVREVSPELKALLEAVRGVRVSEAELQEQRVSFAFGNAPESQFITKESVRTTSHSISLAH